MSKIAVTQRYSTFPPHKNELDDLKFMDRRIHWALALYPCTEESHKEIWVVVLETWDAPGSLTPSNTALWLSFKEHAEDPAAV